MSLHLVEPGELFERDRPAVARHRKAKEDGAGIVIVHASAPSASAQVRVALERGQAVQLVADDPEKARNIRSTFGMYAHR